MRTLLLIASLLGAASPPTQPATRPTTAAGVEGVTMIPLVNTADGYALEYPPTLSEKDEAPHTHIKTKLIELDESRRDRFRETIMIQRIEAAEPLTLDAFVEKLVHGMEKGAQELQRIEDDQLGGAPAKRLITHGKVKGISLVYSYTVVCRGHQCYTFVVAAAEHRAPDFMKTGAMVQSTFRFIERSEE